MDKIVEYKNYQINLSKQPKTGDNLKLTLRIEGVDGHKFIITQIITGTEMRGLSKTEAFELLEKRGLEHATRVIDTIPLEEHWDRTYYTNNSH